MVGSSIGLLSKVPCGSSSTRSLPQLPIIIDDEGYVTATGDFSGPVGPGFWDRGRS